MKLLEQYLLEEEIDKYFRDNYISEEEAKRLWPLVDDDTWAGDCWLIEMAKVPKKKSGLVYDIYIDDRGSDTNSCEHGARIKFQNDERRKMLTDNLTPMTISDNPIVPKSFKTGKVSISELDDIRKWVLGNKTVLLLHWHGYIDPDDVLKVLRPIKNITDEIIKKEKETDVKEIIKNNKVEYYRSGQFLNTPKTLDELTDTVYTEIDKKGPDCNLNHIDTSNIKDMSGLFDGVEFTGDISGWDVSNVKNMTSMFQGCPFNGDISKWNVSNVVYATYMFADSKFNQDISDWNFKKLKSSYGMFENCKIKDSYKPKI